MNNFDQFNQNQLPVQSVSPDQTFDQFQAQLMAPAPNDITPDMLNQFMEF